MLPPRHQRSAKKALFSHWRRHLGDRGVGILVFILALGLTITSLALPQQVDKVRGQAFDLLETVLTVLATPAKKVSTLATHVTGLSDMATDLNALQEENARLKQWYNRARLLEAENTSLRSLVHLAELPQANAVTARMIAESAGSFARSIIVDAGSRENVHDNSVAMTGAGVIGRVMSINERTSHVLLLTDSNSRIPVIIENSRHRGILAGDNSPQPLLMYLPNDASVSVGERVLTSGDAAGIYAPGLPVGVIVSVQGRSIRIAPFADLRRLDFIQLIDFGRDSLLPNKTQEEKPAASAKPAPHHGTAQ